MQSFGVTSVEHPLPITPETLFQTGSISKTYTGTLLMMLAGLRLPTAGSVTQTGTTGAHTSIMNQVSLLTLLLFFVLQALIYTACLVKLAEIRRQKVPPFMKVSSPSGMSPPATRSSAAKASFTAARPTPRASASSTAWT